MAFLLFLFFIVSIKGQMDLIHSRAILSNWGYQFQPVNVVELIATVTISSVLRCDAGENNYLIVSKEGK